MINKATEEPLRDRHRWSLPQHCLIAMATRIEVGGGGSVVKLPLGSPCFLHVGHNDAMGGALGATATSDLDAQTILPLHHVHLPYATPFSGLREIQQIDTERQRQREQMLAYC